MSMHIDGQPDEQDPKLGEQGQAQVEQPRRFAGMTSWVVSGALHGLALLLACTIGVFVYQEDPQEIQPFRPTTMPPPPTKPDEKKKVDLLQPKVTLEIETPNTTDTPTPITALEIIDDTSQTEDLNESTVRKGREEAVADSEAGGPGAFLTIGMGGGGSGIFGNRNGGGKRRMVGRPNCGSKGSESAVTSSLEWFKRHQSPNGMWDHERYFQNCTANPKCEPGRTAHDSAEDLDACMTGYALLCYLGAGYDHQSGKYRTVVKKGLDYLLSVQKPDGMFAARNYAHPVVTMALAEAYAMTADPSLRKPAQLAVDMIVKRQNQDPNGPSGYAGLGWDYVNPGTRNDASVTGWNLMALKSALAAGLNTGNAMEGGKRWLEQAWKATNDGKAGRPDWQKLDPYKDESRFSYTWTTGAKEFSDGFGHQNMAPVGMVCAVFLGHKAGDPMLETLANFVINKQVPKGYPTNTYYMYYNTMGMFQLGTEDPRWKKWNLAVRDMLVDAQKKDDGCLRGSWDWQGTQFPGNEIGRVLSTAYNTLCLEVYYRLAQVQKH